VAGIWEICNLNKGLYRGAVGITLIELLAAIALLGVLATLVVINFQPFLQKTSQIRCMSNMRALHPAFSAYIQDVGHWPQPPDYEMEMDQNYEDWWLTTMDPYVGGAREIWLCPVLKSARLADADGRLLKMHYIPTQFDANPISPTRWPTQPWLVEVANAHGNGALILFTDGSIKSLNSILPGQ